MRMSARVDVEESEPGAHLVVTRIPPGVGPEDVMSAIAARSRKDVPRRLASSHPELHEQLLIPLKDVRDESTANLSRVVCVLEPGADVDECRLRILETWPVSIEVNVELPGPLADVIRGWVDRPDDQARGVARVAPHDVTSVCK